MPPGKGSIPASDSRRSRSLAVSSTSASSSDRIDEIGAVAAILEEGIAADGHARVRGFRFAQQVGDFALRCIGANRRRDDRPSAFELPVETRKHGGRNARYAREDVDISI